MGLTKEEIYADKVFRTLPIQLPDLQDDYNVPEIDNYLWVLLHLCNYFLIEDKNEKGITKVFQVSM